MILDVCPSSLNEYPSCFVPIRSSFQHLSTKIATLTEASLGLIPGECIASRKNVPSFHEYLIYCLTLITTFNGALTAPLLIMKQIYKINKINPNTYKNSFIQAGYSKYDLRVTLMLPI